MLVAALSVAGLMGWGVEAFSPRTLQCPTTTTRVLSPPQLVSLHAAGATPPPPVLDEWKVISGGRVEGKVINHPDDEVQDGSTILTSPVTTTTTPMSFFFRSEPKLRENMSVQTLSGSQYQLLNAAAVPTTSITEEEDVEKELSETKKLMQQVKGAGIAGVISYALWEFGFWTVSVPVCIFAYRQLTGHWPDFANPDDLKQLGAEAFAFVNVARFAVPLRIGLALGTTPWIQRNLVDRLTSKDKNASQSDP